MTIVFMVVSILIGTGSLTLGYAQAGYWFYGRWLILLGLLWLVAHWRKYYWFSSVVLLIFVFAAGFGVWREFPTVWMLAGAVFGLLGWDLSDFAMRMGFAAPTDDVKGMERRHLARVGVVAFLGVGLALLSYVVHIRRLAFEVAVGLILLAALGLARLVIRLRRY